jgi:solute carrier family 25 protein 16
MGTPGRFFVCGASSGVAAVMVTYPMELIRVRMAFSTSPNHRPTRGAEATGSQVSVFTRTNPLYPFYRGFSVTLMGMVPYAGVSFLTYGTLKRHLPSYVPYLQNHPTTRDLSCGAVAGLVSQTCSYPFEVVRRRMQVGGVHGGVGMNWRQAVHAVYATNGLRGFFVGLSIGYIKVVPMTR